MVDSLDIDFIGGAVGHRLRSGGGRGQALPRAAGFSKGRTPSIIDATAGLGRDAFLLASLGANVTMIERSKPVYEALKAAMEKAKAENDVLAKIISRMNLIHGDAKTILPKLAAADAIIIDPMHPPRRTKAKVKKNLRILRDIVGADDDAAELMRIALKTARKRVVLKYPRKADFMADIPKPSHQIIGKTTRYDVFMIQKSET